MDLGDFSVSLAVKDLGVSRAFYEKLGFTLQKFDFKLPGYEENWVVLNHGQASIGLFQGMFEKNILTFNPKDARSIQKELKAQGVKIDKEADESGTGPAHLMLTDPDGNAILIDQF
ncbi:MAG: VOC family protein [Bryobacteraceae bacterium]